MLLEQLDRGYLAETVNKRPLVLYHGTDSAAFTRFAPGEAAKGKQYWNPLGSGMYVSNSAEMARVFGANVYEIVIPPGSNIKKLNAIAWKNAGESMVLRALGKALRDAGHKVRVGDSTSTERAFKETSPEYTGYSFLMELYRQIGRNDPYTDLVESDALVRMYAGPEFADRFSDYLAVIADQKFSKFDIVVFPETNWPLWTYDEKGRQMATFEAVIYNPALQRTGKNVSVIRRYA